MFLAQQETGDLGGSTASQPPPTVTMLIRLLSLPPDLKESCKVGIPLVPRLRPQALAQPLD